MPSVNIYSQQNVKYAKNVEENDYNAKCRLSTYTCVQKTKKINCYSGTNNEEQSEYIIYYIEKLQS